MNKKIQISKVTRFQLFIKRIIAQLNNFIKHSTILLKSHEKKWEIKNLYRCSFIFQNF